MRTAALIGIKSSKNRIDRVIGIIRKYIIGINENVKSNISATGMHVAKEDIRIEKKAPEFIQSRASGIHDIITICLCKVLILKLMPVSKKCIRAIFTGSANGCSS